MLGRTWTTCLKPGCGEAYEAFALGISLPMFRSHEGYMGCVMTRTENVGVVLTFWRDEAAIEKLEASQRYRETVAKILAADLLCEPQETVTRRVHLADIEVMASSG